MFAAQFKAASRRVARWIPATRRPAILMYHGIGSDGFDPWGLLVSEDRFAGQLDWLTRTRTVLPLTEFAARHRQGRLPADAVSLTFDDGYASVFQSAIPLLSQFKVHATIFLPVELIERRRPFWWDELARIVIGFDGDDLRLEDARLSVPPPDRRDRSWPPDEPPRTPRQRLFQSIWRKLRMRTPAELDAAMAQLRGQAARAVHPTSTLIGPVEPEKLRPISSSTVAFGSHGLTHPSLPKLSTEEKLHELIESRARGKALAGSVLTTFAYPYGDLDSETRRLVEHAGYDCACATGDGFVNDRSHPFALPRLRACNWEPERLARLIG